MQSAVESIIYFYLAICIALLVFNIFYIFRSHLVEKRREVRIGRWRNFFAGLDLAEPLPEKELKRLGKVENLITFQTVLGEKLDGDAEKTGQFVRANQAFLRTLAMRYQKRPPMERAYFAYVIAWFHVASAERHDQMAEILLSYFEGSTVFCRENILQALYALGHDQAVEHAFEILNENGWYHSPKLLSDGMAKFLGDKEALAWRLFENRSRWEECLVVGTIQFASMLPGNGFAEPFLKALKEEELPTEARFALVRYFQRHAYEPAEAFLLELLAEHTEEENQLAIAAASALAGYEGENVREALLAAMHSRNWYVRHNAAQSLKRLGLTDAEYETIRTSGDRYALEMLDYAMGIRRKEAGA